MTTGFEAFDMLPCHWHPSWWCNIRHW